MQLRPYQIQGIQAVKDEFASGVMATLLVAATGTGKTVLLSEIAKYYRMELNKPVLFLAHRQELLDQAADTFRKVGLVARIEKAEERAAGRYADVVVASVQSLTQQKRLESYAPDHFGLIETDECHHSVSPSYIRIYEYFKSALHLGVTATAGRLDKIGLKNVYETVAFQYPIQQGIQDGFLCPIRGVQVEVGGIQLEKVKVVAGEFSQPEMDAMLRDEETLQSMVLPTIEHAGDRPTIIFTPGVEHAHEIAACFNRVKPGSATAVDGGMDPMTRKERLDMFKTGRVQFLSNVNIATEGFDHPPTACIAFFRPTKSLGLFSQCVGRATRIHPSKSDALVLDFVGVNNSVRTVTVMDVLDGTILSDAEHKKAQELQKQGYNATESLEKAKNFVANLDSVRAKMRAFTTSSVFDVMGLFQIGNQKGLYGGDRATEKQIAYITKCGINCPPDLEKGEASKLIDTLVKRIDAGKATFKQMKYLRALGYKDSEIENVTFSQASDLIGQLKNKGRGAARAA